MQGPEEAVVFDVFIPFLEVDPMDLTKNVVCAESRNVAEQQALLLEKTIDS